MKIVTLLTDFLYKNRYLNIPGIGYFYIDKDIVIPDPDEKEFDDFLQHIHFQHKVVKEPEDALIDFIREKTGKIRPLAIADLESFLADCKLFINIGKPIFLEGIGTLNKGNQGQLDFVPGAPASEKVDYKLPVKTREKPREVRKKKSPTTQTISFKKPNKRELALYSGIAGALLLIILGGIMLFNYAGKPKEDEYLAVTPIATTSDSSTGQNPVSTITDTPITTTDNPTLPVVARKTDSAVTGPLRRYKFVLQKTSKRDIAVNNYRTIKADRPDLQMESADSVTYTIFVIQKCAPSDTSRQKEILNYWYWGKKEMKVYIEG